MFKCDECGRKFKTSQAKGGHQRLGCREKKTVEKRGFSCEVCGKKFGTSQAIAGHMTGKCGKEKAKPHARKIRTERENRKSIKWSIDGSLSGNLLELAEKSIQKAEECAREIGMITKAAERHVDNAVSYKRMAAQLAVLESAGKD